jgi:hypothetical protein
MVFLFTPSKDAHRLRETLLVMSLSSLEETQILRWR